MPKYLYHGSYTDKGLQGLMKDGGTKRMEITKKAIESLGGNMEAYYLNSNGKKIDNVYVIKRSQGMYFITFKTYFILHIIIVML